MQRVKTRLTHYQDQLASWFSQYNFTHFISVSYLNPCTKSYVMDTKIKRWIQSLERLTKNRFAYLGVFNRKPFPHCHLLVKSATRQNNNFFPYDWTNKDINRWKRQWNGSVDIRDIYDDGAASYIANTNTPNGQFDLLTPYNVKMLMESARQDELNR